MEATVWGYTLSSSGYHSSVLTGFFLSFSFGLVLGWTAPVNAQNIVQPEVFLSGRVALTDRLPLHYTGLQGAASEVLDSLDRVLVRDLTLSALFAMRLPNVPPDTNRSASAATITYLDGQVTLAQVCRVEVRLRSAFRAPPFWMNTYEFPVEKVRAAGHRISADLIRQMTGEPSIMQSRMVFCGKVNGNKELFSTTFDGFDLIQHTQRDNQVFSPDWSPEGTRIAYTSFLAGQADIYILNATTNESRTFQNAPCVDSAPDWSPDGKLMVYSSSPDGNAEIYLRPIDGGEARRLTYSWAIETAPSWSPTGREIAFTSDRLGKPQVFIMDADGANQRRLSTVGNYNDSPAWSPRGDMIAYVRRDEEGFQIFLTDPRGEVHTKLTGGPGDSMDPSWAPDGLHIAFASNRSGVFQIYTMDIFGRHVEHVVNLDMPCTNPAWSPVLLAGEEIVVISKNNKTANQP